VTTPSYPWYALLLVLLVALSGRVAWLAVATAAYVGQYQHELRLGNPTAERIGYGVALVVVVAGWLQARAAPSLAVPWSTQPSLSIERDVRRRVKVRRNHLDGRPNPLKAERDRTS